MATITHVTSTSATAEILKLGTLKIRILSTGSPQTSCLIMNLPRRTPGFPLHYHRMQATTFLILRGRIRFVSPENTFDARVGSFIEVPAGAKYGFSNPFSEVAEMFVVYYPGWYVDCLKELEELWKEREGSVASAATQAQAMKGWGTVVVSEDDEGTDEDETMEEEGEGEESEGDSEDEVQGDLPSSLQCMA